MKVDTLFFNGKFYISSRHKTGAEWLAITDGRVVAFGTEKPERAIFYNRKINLQGYRVMPGWIDSHVHLANIGLRSFEIDLSRAKSPGALIGIMRNKVQKMIHENRELQWIEAYCLDTDRWTKADQPTTRMLDKISRDIPLVIRRVDEHALWGNTAALRAARIYSEVDEIAGGKIMRDEAGRPTGLLLDRAMERVTAVRPNPPAQMMEQALEMADKQLIKLGITSVHDMAMRRLPLEILIDLMRRKRFDLRVYAALYGKEAFETFSQPMSGLFDLHLSLKARKVFVDGALGSRGAWLIDDYEDEKGWRGHCAFDENDILELVRNAIRKNRQLIFHTIGDRASQFVMETIADCYHPEELYRKRFRLEHVEVLHPNTLSLIKRFGFIASVQPWHVISDGRWLKSRLGADRLGSVLPLSAMMRKNLHMCGGSDAPIDDFNPLHGIYAAITRRSKEGLISSLFKQRLDLRYAVKIYTEGGAYAEFAEHEKGSLEIGKLADFAVLSDDIFRLRPEKLLKVKNYMTVIGGNIVYEG